jgi:NTE family protein
MNFPPDRAFFRRIFPLLLSALALSHSALAQAADDEAPVGRTTGGRPKIGLALSGGGARGVAHIGVLKALEELRVPIDYIAGTSMGAIVGGLYASGMSPEELERWFTEVDWRYLLSDAPPRASRSFGSKEREFRLNQNLEVGLSREGQVQLPTGFIAGQKLMVNLRALTLPARQAGHFDRLPIPFRAIATDLETGEKVVLEKGELAEAMRASMAVPAVFTPYRVDGRLLVDGGLAANLPIDTVKAMGADVVIAVDLRMDLRKEAELGSALAVTNQIVDILINRETLAQIERLTPRDVYIRLELPGATSAGFATSAGNIPAGYAEAMSEVAELRALAIPESAFARRIAAQRVRAKAPVRISFFRVDSPSGPVRRSLRNELSFAPGERVEFWQLEKELLGLEGPRNSEVVDFRVVEEEGEFGLVLETRERARGPNFVNLGFDFAYDSAGQTDASVLLSLRMTELNRLGAEWETFLSIGEPTRVSSQWLQPLDRAGPFFVAAHLLYASETISALDAEDHRLSLRRHTLGAGLDAGVRLGDVGEMRIGYFGGVSRISRELGLPEDVANTAARGEVRASLTFDTLDRTNFPTSGIFVSSEAAVSSQALGARDDYRRADLEIYKPVTLGKNTWVPRLVAGVNLGGDDLPFYDRFSLGRFPPSLRLCAARPL